MAGSIIGSYATPPTDKATLISFYRSVRPWGLWRPVHEMVVKEDPGFTGNNNFQRNLLNIVLGIIAQLCLTLLPMYIVLWLKMPLLLTVALLAIIILVLKKTWWDRLNEY